MNIEGGGACKYVADLSNYQSERDGVRVSVLTQAQYASRKLLSDRVNLLFPENSDRKIPFLSGFDDCLSRLHETTPISVVHVHGIWLPCLYEAQKRAKVLGIPILLAPHGMLEPGALTFSPVKKKLAMALFQRRGLGLPDRVMATAGQEESNLLPYFPSIPFFESPPGLDIPADSEVRDWDQSSESVRLLFLSRIHPKKNLIPFLEVFAKLENADYELLIAGPDEKGHTAEVQCRIEQLGLQERVKMLGPIFGEEKKELFRSASIFVLPSLSENFGIVIAEALSFGVPVLTTTATPWRVLEDENLGWWVEGSPEGLHDGLVRAFACSPNELEQMGKRGRAYVAKTFQWRAIADELIALYSDMIQTRASA
jgi:glycosyltransferase involved in cell wall biosynthesis